VIEYTDLQIEILKILSDEVGHAQWQLVERLKKLKSNLDVSLNKLESEWEVSSEKYFYEKASPDEADEYYPWFSIGDIKDPVGLAAKLRGANNSLSRFIYEQFSDISKQILKETDDHRKLRHVLVRELNKLLNVPSLYNKERFANVKLGETTGVILNEKPHGLRLNLLNRELLEEAYPKEIAKYGKPIIYNETRKTTRPKSKHPGQSEFPYYINRDPDVFQSIINYLNFKEDEAFENEVESSLSCDAELKKKRLEMSLTPEEVVKLRTDFSYKGHNISFWKEESAKYDKNLKDFLCSRYTGNLIKEYGLFYILQIMENSDIPEMKRICAVQSAFNNKLITKKELEDII
jgi:hypothetical protein